MSRFPIVVLTSAMAIVAVVPATGQDRILQPVQHRQSLIRNPSFLTARAELARRQPGIPRLVRFEWESVPRASHYLLRGSWTDPDTWIVQRWEFRVTPQTARRWEADAVTFEVPLPPGSHSWNLVAVFAPGEVGDYARPTRISFDIESGGTHDQPS